MVLIFPKYFIAQKILINLRSLILYKFIHFEIVLQYTDTE